MTKEGLLSIVTVLLLAGCSSMQSPELSTGWTTLIDGGSGLEHFDRVGDANWRSEDGAIVADKAKAASRPELRDRRDRECRQGLADAQGSGKWNTYEITAKGPQLVVVLNGVKTVDVQDSKFTQGPFALQFGNGPKDAPGGAIKWCKVQVRPL
jgi:3-keto-disaccharide hydrolase